MRIISFEMPDKALNMNDSYRHWSVKSKRVKAWREAAYWAAVQALKGDRSLGPTTVHVRIPVTTKAKRDPSNWMPTAKAIVDGLNTAGCWPDDNSDWVTVVEPTLYLDSNRTNLVHVELTPRENS